MLFTHNEIGKYNDLLGLAAYPIYNPYYKHNQERHRHNGHRRHGTLVDTLGLVAKSVVTVHRNSPLCLNGKIIIQCTTV